MRRLLASVLGLSMALLFVLAELVIDCSTEGSAEHAKADGSQEEALRHVPNARFADEKDLSEFATLARRRVDKVVWVEIVRLGTHVALVRRLSRSLRVSRRCRF